MIYTPKSPSSSQHFLIVEPDPLFRLLLCIAVSDQFSDFHAVATFAEAQTLLREHSFAAIIAEYHLPGGSGLGLYEAVRREAPSTPFILMCGGMRLMLSDPRFRFLAKPFPLTELVASLAEMGAARTP